MSSDLLVLIRRVAFLPRTVNHGIVSTIFPILFVLLCLPGLGSGQSGAGPDPRNEPYNYTRLSPAMAVIVVILIAALFFMGFFSIYIRHCIGSRADGSINPVTGARRAAAANAGSRGLDASVIDSFPTFVYAEVKNLKIGKDALECAVCLNEFEDDETLRLLPKCDHVFHPHCIDAWLEGHVTCPVCRTNLSEHNPDDELPITQSQNDVEVQTEPEPEQVAAHNQPPELRGTDGSGSLRGNRTRGSRSGRTRVKFPRSHSTGHSLVQPGEDTERFTLRVPAEVRKQIMANRELNRSKSLVVLPREGSSRRGKRVERIQGRSDRWLFLRTPSFIWRSQREGNSVQRGGTIQLGGRASSTRDSARSDRWSFLRAPSFLGRNSSVRTPQDPTSGQPSRTDGSTGDSVRLPV